MNVSVEVPFEVSGVMGAVEMDIVDVDNYIYVGMGCDLDENQVTFSTLSRKME
jgi:hypothetical protein